MLSTLTRDGSRRLTKNRKQVQVDGSRYRGCDGTCVGVMGRTCAGDFRDTLGGFLYYNHGIHLHGLSKRTASDIKQELIIIINYKAREALLHASMLLWVETSSGNRSF